MQKRGTLRVQALLCFDCRNSGVLIKAVHILQIKWLRVSFLVNFWETTVCMICV